jgi:hypothetical protein
LPLSTIIVKTFVKYVVRFCPLWMKAFFCIEDSEIDDIESITDEDFEDDELIVNDASEDINNLEELEFENP